MVRIPAGEYVMGGKRFEYEYRTVALTYDFYMGVYEVDQLLFSVVMGLIHKGSW